MVLQSSLVTTVLIFHLAGLAGGQGHADRTPALEEIITRCEAPDEFDRNRDGLAAGPSDKLSLPGRGMKGGVLVLVRGGSGLDIVHAAPGDASDWRAGQSEAKLIDSGGNGSPYHLVLNRVAGPEHFLFSVAGDGTGELLWSTGTVTAVTDCRPG